MLKSLGKGFIHLHSVNLLPACRPIVGCYRCWDAAQGRIVKVQSSKISAQIPVMAA
ncbi:hypothetical protein OCAR_5906 [Afipia carboxidovorans OM5]|nr:hypothetical protein OCAR_5906 [Afipia carboxidovorans OM5]